MKSKKVIVIGGGAAGLMAAYAAAKNGNNVTLIEKNEKVLVAFSGGYDSLCLALCLKELGYTKDRGR